MAKEAKLLAALKYLSLTIWANDVVINIMMTSAAINPTKRTAITTNLTTSGVTAKTKTITKTSKTTNVRKIAGEITVPLARAIATIRMPFLSLFFKV